MRSIHIERAGLIILGLVLSIVFIEIALRACGAILLLRQELRNKSHTVEGEYRIMCLGESTTQEQYPRFLEGMLNKKSHTIKYTVIDKGLVGTNSLEILAGLEHNIEKYKPRMITVMMGVNDRDDIVPWNHMNKDSFIVQLKTYRLYLLLMKHAREKVKNMLGHFHAVAYAEELAPATQDDKEKELYARKCFVEIKKRAMNEHAANEYQVKFKNTVQDNPDNPFLFREYGRYCTDYDFYEEADRAYARALDVLPPARPGRMETDQLIAHNYVRWKKYAKAIKILKRLIRESPDNPDLHRELFIAYRSQKKYARCRQILERLIMLDRSDNSIYALALSIGEKDLADRYHKESTYRYYAPATCSNYQELAKRVLAKRIKLVCMQYPLRSIGPLKAVLCQYKGILFVDNEKTFRDALLASDYDSLFRDQFAPDFGHCTDHGNKLIAENLADTIIKEVEH